MKFLDVLIANQSQQGGGDLPSGYTRCEYLESSGTQYIMFGTTFVPSSNKVETIIDCLSKSPVNKNVTIGVGTQSGYWCGPVDSYWGLGTGLKTSALVTSRNSVSFIPCCKGYSFAQLEVDGSVTNRNGTTLTTNQPMSYFGIAAEKNYLTVYGAILKIDDEIVENHIPAICNAGTTYTDGNTLKDVTPTEDKVGMYDTISGHFFVNQGTGEFTYQLA